MVKIQKVYKWLLIRFKMNMSMSLIMKACDEGACPEFLAPVKYRLSRVKLRRLNTYEETDFNVTAKHIKDRFRNLSGLKDIVVPNFERVLQEWRGNAESHAVNEESIKFPEKQRIFSASSEGLFYLGMQDPGKGFDLRSVLESGRYLDPVWEMIRGRGICETSRAHLDWIYNINRAHDHTIVGIKKFHS